MSALTFDPSPSASTTHDGAQTMWVHVTGDRTEAPLNTHLVWPMGAAPESDPLFALRVVVASWLRWTRVEHTDIAAFTDYATGNVWEVTRTMPGHPTDDATPVYVGRCVTGEPTT